MNVKAWIFTFIATLLNYFPLQFFHIMMLLSFSMFQRPLHMNLQVWILYFIAPLLDYVPFFGHDLFFGLTRPITDLKLSLTILNDLESPPGWSVPISLDNGAMSCPTCLDSQNVVTDVCTKWSDVANDLESLPGMLVSMSLHAGTIDLPIWRDVPALLSVATCQYRCHSRSI